MIEEAVFILHLVRRDDLRPREELEFGLLLLYSMLCHWCMLIKARLMKPLYLLVIQKAVATSPHFGAGASAGLQLCMILFLLAACKLALFIGSSLHFFGDGRHVDLSLSAIIFGGNPDRSTECPDHVASPKSRGCQ